MADAAARPSVDRAPSDLTRKVTAARAALTQVTVTPVSPFRPDGELDLDGIQTLAGSLVVSGLKSVAVAGNTGEFHALSEEEIGRMTVIWRLELGQAAFLWLGVAGGLEEIRRRVRQASLLGADGILLHSPPHTYLSADGVKRYLENVLDMSADEGLPVVLYKRDARLPDGAVVSLRDHPSLAGIKYAVNDLAGVAELVGALEGKLELTCGSAELWATAFHTVGARGFTSGLAQVAPALSLGLRQALQDGDLAEASRLVSLMAPFEILRREAHSALNIPVVKAAMNLRAMPGGNVRPPLEDLDADGQKRLAAILRHWQEAGAWL